MKLMHCIGNRVNHSIRYTAPALLCVAGIFLGAIPCLAVTEGQLKPVPPASLLKVMAKGAPGWKIQSSTGETYYSRGLFSRAVRSFEYVPEDPAAEGAGAICKMTLTDSAGHTSRLRKFSDFKAGRGSGFQKMSLMSYPAIVMDVPNYGTTVSMLVGKRFTLDFLLKGLTLDKLKPWIEACDLRALAGVRGEPMDVDINVIEIVQVDELNPDRNRTYPLVLSDRKAIAAGLEHTEDIDLPGDGDDDDDDEGGEEKSGGDDDDDDDDDDNG